MIVDMAYIRCHLCLMTVNYRERTDVKLSSFYSKYSIIKMDGRTVRRNRNHLTAVPNTPVTQHYGRDTNVTLPSPVHMPTRTSVVTRSKTETVTRPPQRF